MIIINKHILKFPFFQIIGISSLNGIRHSSFRSSQPVADLSEYPEVEIVKNPPEWKFVENILPNLVIPEPKEKLEYPSGWKPQNFNAKSEYFIGRTRNHMMPVYLFINHRGMRRLTKIRRIQGDIWKLEIELKAEIEKQFGKKVISRVNEMSGQIAFKGDFVAIVNKYLMEKGF